MFRVIADTNLYQYTGGTPPEGIIALTRQYECWEGRRSPDGSQIWLNWVMRVREHGSLVGYGQATVYHDHAQVAWVVGADWQGRGYASESTAAIVGWLIRLGVSDIRANIHPEHLASIKVAERAGLTRTAMMAAREVIWRLRVNGGRRGHDLLNASNSG